MRTFYQIVSKKDRCYFIGKDENGKYRLKSKDYPLKEMNLLFTTEDEVNEYIESYFNPNDYKAEKVMLDETYYPTSSQ